MLDFPLYSGSFTTIPRPSVAPTALDTGAIRVDLRSYVVLAHDAPIQLTPLEFDLLVYLIRNAERAVPNEEIVHNVIRGVYRQESSIVRVHVAHLRKKLGLAAQSIVTVRGRGLLFRNAI